jgi:mRNA interferase HigB
MKVSNRQILVAFWEKHQQTRQPLKAWLADVDNARWGVSTDVVNHFPNAREIPGNRIIFNIKGGQYRLIVQINYRISAVDIRFIGTHQDYDRIDAEKI